MGVDDSLAVGRATYARRAWDDAFTALREVESSLAPDDLERLAIAAYLTGRSDTAMKLLERLHLTLLEKERIDRAAVWAVWLAILLSQGGHHAQAEGWLARAERLVTKSASDGPAAGYLRIPRALQAMGAGDPAQALSLFEDVTAIASRHADADLTVLGVLGRGQALIAMGDARAGVTKLDEAMVAVTAGEVSPIMAGIAYCAMVITCRDIFDLRRAQEWTAVLSRWCSDQQGLRPYRGQCLVHRSEIMQLGGDWRGAMEEIERACRHLDEPPGDPAIGMAHYQHAELLRLQGRYVQAEAAYRRASEAGHPPQPGIALLRLAQGRVDDADAAIRREVADAGSDRVRRARMLAAYVEILLAADDVDGARVGVDELETIAADFDSLYLEALATEARGAVLLAEGDAVDACIALRHAWQAWYQLGAPFEGARVRLAMARACRLLGDRDTADMELDAAQRVFQELGATPALADAMRLAGTSRQAPPAGLTPRELQVLRLVATGASNRRIADTLVISEKTVARHLSNMFVKLDVDSRAAATAWAYQHELA